MVDYNSYKYIIKRTNISKLLLIKNYLRYTMHADRLQNVMLLNINKAY